MKSSDRLQSARARIEDPKNWCQGVFVDEDGRYCAIGALADWGSSEHSDHELGILNMASVAFEMPFAFDETFAHDVNDRLGHSAVMDMYDVAISMALSDETGNDA